MLSHHGFYLYFLMASDVKHHFTYQLTFHFFREMSVQVFHPLFSWIIWFLLLNYIEFFIYFGYESLIRYLQILSRSIGLCHFVDGFLCCAAAF